MAIDTIRIGRSVHVYACLSFKHGTLSQHWFNVGTAQLIQREIEHYALFIQQNEIRVVLS